MKKTAIILLGLLTVGCSGNRVKQEIESRMVAPPEYFHEYLSTKVYYNGDFIKEYKDEIDSVTPKLREQRIKQGEELLKNFE